MISLGTVSRNWRPTANVHCTAICKLLHYRYKHVAFSYNLSDRQLKEINVCWNSVFRKIFKFNQWESVKCFIHGLDRLALH